MNPLISIIVPCYNQAQFLPEALHSVLQQTYKNWECIIVNDGSPDNTEEVARQWLAKDPRFKYIQKENGGLSSARNAGLDLVTGHYIQFLDSDDCLGRDKLEISILQIKNPTENNIVLTNFKMFKMECNDSLTAYCDLKQELLTFNTILHDWDYKFTIPIHCGLFSKSLFLNFQFPEVLKAKEDWIMWLVLFQKISNIVFVDKILAFYRTHDENMTKNTDHMIDNRLKALNYLDKVISQKDYKEYLLSIFKLELEQNYRLKKSVVNSNNSIGYKIEKKIRKFLFKN